LDKGDNYFRSALKEAGPLRAGEDEYDRSDLEIMSETADSKNGVDSPYLRAI